MTGKPPFALPKTVDRGIVRMMAIKRTIGGSLSLLGALVITVIVLGSDHRDQRTITSLAGTWLLLGAGGAWSLYDGLRLLKLLRTSGS